MNGFKIKSKVFDIAPHLTVGDLEVGDLFHITSNVEDAIEIQEMYLMIDSTENDYIEVFDLYNEFITGFKKDHLVNLIKYDVGEVYE